MKWKIWKAWTKGRSVAVGMALLVGGCTSSFSLEKVGLADVLPAPPELIDILCDASAGSTCTTETLAATLRPVVQRAAARPGSVVRMWLLGVDLVSTTTKAEVVSPRPSGRTPRARQAELGRWQEHASETLLAAVSALLKVAHPPSSSPLAEGLTQVALADGHNLPRKVIVVSDGRETGIFDFECKALPTDARWSARLGALRLLMPESMSGVEVAFTFVTMPPIKGCSVTVRRELRIRELWANALTAAGASEVRMLSGPIAWSDTTIAENLGGGR